MAGMTADADLGALLSATLAAANPAAAIANGPAPDAIAVLKEVANARSEEAADLIKAWLETSEDAA